MSLPGHPQLARRDGRLVLEACDLDALAREHGTPLYVYSRQAMTEAARGWRAALIGRPHLVCFGVKANSSLAVLQLMAREGLGFDIVSAGELARVLAAGADASTVVFSGVGKTADEMRAALRAGVRCFNVESLGELERLDAVARAEGRTAPVSLRVNPDVDAGTHPYISTGLRDNKFGIAHGQALAVYRRAAELAGLAVVGIDVHIGSQITDLAPYLDAVERVLDLVDALRADGIELQHVDFGGGLGITYTDEVPPSPQDLVRAIVRRLDARGHGDKEVLFEPGRSLVGPAGVLLTEVQYLKPGPPDGKSFCIVDAAMNDLLRPSLYGAWMRIEPCVERPGGVARRWDVVGPVCESGDWLGRDRDLAVACGDRLAVLCAGAYGMTMASNYNSRPRPAELMIDGAHAVLIRERETVASLFAGEHLLPP